MAGLVATLASPQNWPPSALLLAASLVFLVAVRLLRRPCLPPGASWMEKGLPLIGCLSFFTKRRDFLRQGKGRSPNGYFSFYYGSYPIVALSGETGRAAHYATRGLDLSAGFRKLFSAGPDIDRLLGRSMKAYFITLFKRLVAREYLATALPYLVKDTRASFEAIDTSVPMDPFVVVYELIYKMTHRTVGCHEIANDPALLKKTLGYYSKLDKSSAVEVMFPWMPTPTKFGKMWAGTKMQMLLMDIIRSRRETGRRADDVMQMQMDKGESDMICSTFIIGSLFAGLVNTGVQSAWIIYYFACDPFWYSKVQGEVDAAVAKYRTSEKQSPVDVLQGLSIEAWETEFPLLNFGVRDSIRLNLLGTSMRQNTSGKDITLGDTGIVLPKNAFAIAKLELSISTAMFFAMFDFKAVDKQGNPKTGPLPRYDSNLISAGRMLDSIYVKCDRRF
ncbi:cytochrome P450 6A1 [Trichoderma cornu-damae]|uniref:Cytochrome P450 6A1 n=1 Tax=Trichoderma cornu-damae TaxID=654480 RepID=A0A9P8QDM0_9HYPO|nr:cytochrome P450 6A1 [Trichoderma cornu-damae]